MAARRTTLTLAAALLAHAAVALLLPARVPATRVSRAAGATATDELAIEVERAAVLPPTPPEEIAALDPARSRLRALAGATHAAVPTATTTSVDDASSERAAGNSAEPSDAWTFNPTKPAEGALGIGEHTGALARASGVELSREERAAGQPVTQLGDDADRAAGHARGNPLRDAVEQAARSSDAPSEGFALFEITVGPKQPARVRLLEGSSDEAGWSRILGAANIAARARTVRFPPDGRGLRVVVRVDASLRLPDGRTKRALGVHVDSRGFEYHPEAGPDAPKITLPSKTLRLGGKVCSLALTTDLSTFPISGGCNPDAIGTHLARQVTARIESEERVSLAE